MAPLQQSRAFKYYLFRRNEFTKGRFYRKRVKKKLRGGRESVSPVRINALNVINLR